MSSPSRKPNQLLEIPSLVVLVAVFVPYCLMCLLVGLPLLAVVYLIAGLRPMKAFASNYCNVTWYPLVWLFEVWFGMDLHWYGDNLPERESAIVTTNHQWFADWVVVFSLASRQGMLGVSKVFVKDSIFWIPGWGLSIWMMDGVFLKRKWTKDQKSIQSTFHNLKTTDLPFWIMSHPEGTRFSKEKLKESRAWARKNDLPVLDHLLSPRRKGIVATIQGLRGSRVNYLYDLTIVYGDKQRNVPTWFEVVTRRGGPVHVHIRRIPLEDIPMDREALDQWVTKLWNEKDHLLVDFHNNGGRFPNAWPEETTKSRRWLPLGFPWFLKS